jgi:hypothetical protein
MEIAFVVLGALFMVISLVEIASVLFGGLHTLGRLTGILFGRNQTPESGMDQAMFWLKVIGLLILGGLAIAVGLSVQGA